MNGDDVEMKTTIEMKSRFWWDGGMNAKSQALSVPSAFVAVCFALLVGCSDSVSEVQYKQFALGGFSPDASRLSLTYCTSQPPACRFGLLGLGDGAFAEIIPKDQDQVYEPGGFSPDGKKLAVTVRRNSEAGRFAQIGILDIDTQSLAVLTKSPSFKSSPSFSHDGKKIIFSQANRERESGKTRFSGWDVYELKIDGAKQHRLTSLEFFQITPPAYLPDDQRFIFSGDGPHAYVSPSGQTGHEAYRAQFRENSIFLLNPDDTARLIPMLSNGPFSDFPAISRDGSKIVYRARTDEMDGTRLGWTYDLFMFDGSNHRRLTQLYGMAIDAVLSPDGKLVALVAEPRRSQRTRELKLLNVASGQVTPLDPAQLYRPGAKTR